MYVAARADSGWAQPVPVTDSTTSGTLETGAYVDPDERFMIVAIIGRADAISTAEGIYPRADLYVRERLRGSWSAPRHLSPPINSAAEEGAPFVSPDGKFLYFMSERGPLTEHGTMYDAAGLDRVLHAPGNGLGDIYRVDFKATGIAPNEDKEAAILVTLDPGSYTAVIRGKNNTTGVALVEVFQIK